MRLEILYCTIACEALLRGAGMAEAPIHDAAVKGDVPALEAQLDKGVDVDVRNEGQSPRL